MFEIKTINSISDISAEVLHTLDLIQYPFISHGFLSAMEDSDCATSNTGWTPRHLLVLNNDNVIGFCPGYLKTHSYGEYVFDWSWANAYHQNGFDYYPKVLCAAPFTPSIGPRLLLNSEFENQRAEIWQQIIKYQVDHCTSNNLSSWHLLFANENEFKALDTLDIELIKRADCQFQWFNHNYQNFEDFLNRLASRKRKNIKKERSKIIQSGITVKRFTGDEITGELLDRFYLFYHSTYLKRGRQGYLNKEFFELALQHMPNQLFLCIAFKDSEAIAGALFFYDLKTLYGRYWGCLEEIDGLHFECCYYQGIEFAIEKGLERFDPGTQGEHKIPRGFEPVQSQSLHYIAHPGFKKAIDDFVTQEACMVEKYMQDARELLPFKKED